MFFPRIERRKLGWELCECGIGGWGGGTGAIFVRFLLYYYWLSAVDFVCIQIGERCLLRVVGIVDYYWSGVFLES